MRLKVNVWQLHQLSPIQWVEEYESARKELFSVRKKNSAIIKENTRIRKENELGRGRFYVKRNNLEHKISDEAASILARETKMRKEMQNMREGDWLSNIAMLPVGIRGQIARIVWWDYFSTRGVKNRWAALDEYVAEPYTEHTEDELFHGLCIAGYSPWEAHRRASGERNDV